MYTAQEVTVRVGIIGAGHIGGNIAHFLAGAGHEVTVSFCRDPAALDRLVTEIGQGASAASPAAATSGADVVVVSVPWPVIDQALAQAGPLAGRVVIDTSNQFGVGAERIPAGQTAAQFNQARMPGARYTKSFNTLTAAFQRRAATRDGDGRVVQWLCGDDAEAKAVVATLITGAGFVPVDLGGTADAAVMEAPRRRGAVYGEEYRERDARAVVEAVRQGKPIPPTPSYPPEA
jgi:8-hydroxy-5-deazaflavin:NADPH oxidoreductase